MTPEDILFKQFRNLPPHRSKKFVDWKHKKYGMMLHHALGSVGRLKLNDYLTHPVNMEQHLTAHKDMKKFFIEFLPDMVNDLFVYINEVENSKTKKEI